jgi:hypothetical protein
LKEYLWESVAGEGEVLLGKKKKRKKQNWRVSDLCRCCNAISFFVFTAGNRNSERLAEFSLGFASAIGRGISERILRGCRRVVFNYIVESKRIDRFG